MQHKIKETWEHEIDPAAAARRWRWQLALAFGAGFLTSCGLLAWLT